ncbi:hypothetical protein [Rickettsia endosymbiont of Cardiosporidium cionae]|uniref:hypothetical protein n=1 Tax=Rickettsia endosymbiont of Cardiosporidium cionae TaxID=2777155 RepID=UPI001894ED66|nr:hypothetical protein [Rickettsia endosymbiont of Cardiosporidium cionae]KAF8818967.1 hypothetical protein IHI24_000202 [Rickettsia endosymbiont of Cardiosporidium cionae]
MSKAKIGSKNNPSGRSQSLDYFYNNQKVRPVKFIDNFKSCLAAEYYDSGELVKDKHNNLLTWNIVVNNAVRK